MRAQGRPRARPATTRSATTSPAACHAPAGRIATGMPCGDSSQCESAYCNTGTGVCGTCAAARGAVGSPCYRDDDCVYGVVCTGAATTTSPATAGTCTQLVASGADCDTQHPCERSLACKSGMCASPDEAAVHHGHVRHAGRTVLQGGGGQRGRHVHGRGARSHRSTVRRRQRCYCQCSGGGNCALANATSGTCQAPIADGMPCDATKGHGCTSPAVCTGGVCTVPNPANCH